MHGQLHWNVNFPFVFTQKLVLITHSIISATHDCRGGTRVTCPIGIQSIVAFCGVICRSFDSQGGGGTAIIIIWDNKGMCCCEEYGFQATYPGIGYRNHRVWVQNRVSFSRISTVQLDEECTCSLDQGNQEFSSQVDIKVQCVGLSLFLEMVTLGQVHFCVEILGVQYALQFMVTKFSRTRSGIEEGFWGPSGTCPPKHS